MKIKDGMTIILIQVKYTVEEFIPPFYVMSTSGLPPVVVTSAAENINEI